MKINSPFCAPQFPPVTGASRKCTRRSAQAAAIFFASSGETVLEPGQEALGTVTMGFGNNSSSGEEGAVSGNAIGTYMHGPALARNPSLADYILHRATGLALGPIELPDQAAVRQQYLKQTA